MKVQTLPLAVRPAELEPLRALPAEWDVWAEEPAYQVLVLEDGGEAAPGGPVGAETVVGALHVALVSATEAWLEGLRVRSDRQGRGIGRQLVASGEALAKRYGAGVARTAIPAHEYAAQAVGERAGYRPVARAVVFQTDLGNGPVDIPYDAPVREATEPEVPALTTWLLGTEAVTAWHGLVPLGWRFRHVLPELVKGLTRDRRVLRTGERGRRGWVEGGVFFRIRLDAAVLSVLDGPASHVQALVGTVAERARAAGARRLALFASDDRLMRTIRARWEPHPWCPDGLVLVEKDI